MYNLNKKISKMLLVVFFIGNLVPMAFAGSIILNAEAASKVLESAIEEQGRYLKFLEQEIIVVEALKKGVSKKKVLALIKEATERLESIISITKQEIEKNKKTIEHNLLIVEEEKEVIALKQTPYFKKPDHAFYDIALKDLSEDQEFFSSKNIALSGWIRKQIKPKNSRYTFFSFGLGDAPEITLIFDVNKTTFNSSIIGQPLYVMGEFVTEVSIETDFETVTFSSALLVSHISKNWEMLK